MALQACLAGRLLVEPNAVLPAGLSLQSSGASEHWRSVADLDRVAFEAELAKVGWTFFYMAGEIKKHAFGLDPAKRVRTAVGRIIHDVRSQKCNCVEITGLENRSFLGLPYVSVTAHARHIQDGPQFRGR